MNSLADQQRAMSASHHEFRGTVFCDLDGTIVEHDATPLRGTRLVPLSGTHAAVANWIAQGYEVVITTARPIAQEGWIAFELRRHGVPFHRLICGLSSGPRVLINDRKPTAALSPNAIAVEVARDQGVEDVDFIHPQLRVVRQFKGGSAAETLLVDDGTRRFVRKRVHKIGDLSMGYTRLHAQARSLERFAKINPQLVPRLERELDDRFEYYFDLEYLAGHLQLDQVDDAQLQQYYVDQLSQTLADDVYRHECLARPSTDWLVAHLAAKVYPLVDTFLSHPALRSLVTNDTIKLNDERLPSIPALLGRDLTAFAPRRITAAHGDLTFENILVRGDSWRVIDMDGANYLDAPELDLGKLFQSAVARYETWAHRAESPPVRAAGTGSWELEFPTGDTNLLSSSQTRVAWQQTLACGYDEAQRRGIFYMGLHLLRMAPFRLLVSPEQALYAALLGVYHLDQVTRENT